MAPAHAAGGSGFRQDLEGLGQGVDALKADVASLARGAVDAARSGAAELRQGAENAVETAKTSATDATESFKGVVARNPLVSVGIAAGVGILIGLVVFRPRS